MNPERVMNQLVDRLNNRTTRILGSLHRNLLEAFWFIKVPNAGDLVTPFLLRQYGFTPVHSWPPKARLIGCGSLLRYLDAEYDGCILGSGFLRDGEASPLPKARVLAVRGAKSRDRIGAPVSTPLGDPGLLMARFCQNDLPKKYTLGVLPHYVDKENAAMLALMRRYPQETHFIDIQTTPEQVMEEIARCQYLLSSSLHGCIFADALKVPVIWPAVAGHEEERDFKFADYASIYSKPLLASPFDGSEALSAVLALDSAPASEEVDAAIDRLDQAFLTLKKETLGS
jgi:hypothetical protein